MFMRKVQITSLIGVIILLVGATLTVLSQEPSSPKEPAVSKEPVGVSTPRNGVNNPPNRAVSVNQKAVVEKSSPKSAVVREIEIIGNQRSKTADILALLQTRKGQTFDPQLWNNEDWTRLANSGRFQTVVVEEPIAVQDGVKLTIRVVEKNKSISEFCSGPPEMVFNQAAMPAGGRVVLYSRNRFGNYPLASYALHLGLRGDDARVRNAVNLLFGNAYRSDAFKGAPIDDVPGSSGNGSAGMDGGAPQDRFQVSCYGGNRNKIIDLGKVNYETLAIPKGFVQAKDRVYVKQGHVYCIRLLDKNDPRFSNSLYFKLKVIEHRDNDAVMIDWEPLKPSAEATTNEDF
ncbi:MAG: POTRA domain-containing protein [Planctomycetota bacterium]